jgi:hypothetical protein
VEPIPNWTGEYPITSRYVKSALSEKKLGENQRGLPSA